MSDLFSKDIIVPLENAGRHVNCLRCQRQCVVAETKNLAARPVQHADGKGFCLNCTITQWLRTDLDLEWILPPGVDVRDALRLPHIQEQFERIFEVGRADADAGQIHWEIVIANWELPLCLTAKSKRRTKR